ncbi:hypothetical protein AVEN_4842-1 [Araneus ventricosus]|uniref:Uncharacterized protein n=1 Tax=Araneus ventricosus TaxID=182803 RepID=A0A4Y2VGE0_ARAVE|nr:hypothetical protein AVEN_4842-1 [Araneus ventricosus]
MVRLVFRDDRCAGQWTPDMAIVAWRRGIIWDLKGADLLDSLIIQRHAPPISSDHHSSITTGYGTALGATEICWVHLGTALGFTSAMSPGSW